MTGDDDVDDDDEVDGEDDGDAVDDDKTQAVRHCV